MLQPKEVALPIAPTYTHIEMSSQGLDRSGALWTGWKLWKSYSHPLHQLLQGFPMPGHSLRLLLLSTKPTNKAEKTKGLPFQPTGIPSMCFITEVECIHMRLVITSQGLDQTHHIQNRRTQTTQTLPYDHISPWKRVNAHTHTHTHHMSTHACPHTHTPVHTCTHIHMNSEGGKVSRGPHSGLNRE